jgi:hypothetical protein
MKKNLLVGVCCLLFVFPLSAFSEQSDSIVVNNVISMIADGNTNQMVQTLEELQAKVQTCKTQDNKTPAMEQYCQEIIKAVSLLEQSLNQD